MIEGDVNFRSLYRHKRTGVVYRVVIPVDYTTQMKFGDGAWTPCVIYQRDENPNGVFVRDLAKFKLNFEEVK